MFLLLSCLLYPRPSKNVDMQNSDPGEEGELGKSEVQSKIDNNNNEKNWQ